MMNTNVMSKLILNLILVTLILCVITDRIIAPDTLLKIDCSNSTYEPNSQYHTNLNSLFSSLEANATKNKDGFYSNMVVGESGGSDTVYGLFLCRGDDTVADCRNCVANATKSISRECPTHPISATVWFVDCMVRYSNKSIVGVVTNSPALIMISEGANMTTNVTGFMQLVGETMTTLAQEAAKSSTKYAIKEAKFDSFDTVYAMAQCTQDISSHQCQRCLTLANTYFPQFCNSSKGARVLIPSCNVRYDIVRFYQLRAPPPSASPTPPPPSSPPPPYALLPLPSTPSTSPPIGKKKTFNFVNVAILVLVVILVLLVSIFFFAIWRRGKNRSNAGIPTENHIHRMNIPPNFDYLLSGDLINVKSLQYDLITLQSATNNFSDDNKIGEGGFGLVYKGILSNGREIAVKRLSTTSNQGVEQFKNEVVFVAKLQHRNLVKLLGFCLSGYEKLLVYEYAPNKSLELFLFDPTKRRDLNWSRRYNIIKGIARGMLYLHEDSRLRIIHRDLKASNILLDADMNPKISDFGMAKNFMVDGSPTNTSRIAGTFGYMAPEYLLDGEFSTKSDVYSFGILLLEIVTGMRSSNFRRSKVDEHLLTYVWKHWIEDTPLEIIDPCLGDSYSNHEVIRCIQLGLLCVHRDPEKRPSMAAVTLNLSNSSNLSEPEEPFNLVNGMRKPSITSIKPEFHESTSKSILLSFEMDRSMN